MNFGFNSNVRVGDAKYHVQSEDRGAAHPFLDTVVYLAGRVIYKRSTRYEPTAGGKENAELAGKLHERLSQQHHAVISELEAGTLAIQAKKTAEPVTDETDTEDTLDLRLVNPKSWLAAGKVTLEIELCEKRSKRRVEGAEVQACLEHNRRRTPCAEIVSDAKGCGSLKFSMPGSVADGSSLVVRATDGLRYAELRFQLKSKSHDKTPAPVSR